MFFWLLCTQFYTPIFGLFYTQYSLLITIIHCCWYITIMLYIYTYSSQHYIPLHLYIHIYIYTSPLYQLYPRPHVWYYTLLMYTYTYIYIHITIVAGISQYTIYMEVSYVMGGPMASASVAAFTSTAVPVLFHAMVTSEPSPWGNPRKMI